MRQIRQITKLCAFLALLTTSAHATLLRTEDLILDTITGLQWVTTDQFITTVEPDRLPAGRRYATEGEVASLIASNVRIYDCFFFGGTCETPEDYAGVRDFVTTFAPSAALFNSYIMRAAYGVTDFHSMYVNLSFDNGRTFLDTQSGPLPPIHDFSMLLVATTPEPATWLLFVTGLLIIAYLKTNYRTLISCNTSAQLIEYQQIYKKGLIVGDRTES